jgi:hypothetical protein
MAFQILDTAAFRLVNFLTGLTPGRLRICWCVWPLWSWLLNRESNFRYVRITTRFSAMRK